MYSHLNLNFIKGNNRFSQSYHKKMGNQGHKYRYVRKIFRLKPIKLYLLLI